MEMWVFPSSFFYMVIHAPSGRAIITPANILPHFPDITASLSALS